ncbi:MAG: hypothetical protein QOD32_1919 [Pyrinomonadaceae bacterium]|jgi:hypothetical protein|nr:hypothetical protein [Pyrinomonadaceae bacterium]
MKQINALITRLLLACAVCACAASVCGAQTTTTPDNKQQPVAAEKAAAPDKEKAAEKPSALDEELSKTPAGKTAAKFFAAFNSGDIKVMRAFHESTGGDVENAEKDMGFYEQSGGLKPHSLISSSKEQVSVLVQTKKDGRWINFEITVEAQEPHGISRIGVRPASAPAAN